MTHIMTIIQKKKKPWHTIFSDVFVSGESFAELHHGSSCKVIATGTRIFLLFIIYCCEFNFMGAE